MSPQLASYDVVDCGYMQSEFTGYGRAVTDVGMSCPDGSDHIWRELGLRIGRSLLRWHFYQASSVCMLRVLLNGAPFKIANVVVRWIAVNVIDTGQLKRVREKCKRNEPVDLVRSFDPVGSQIDAQMPRIAEKQLCLQAAHRVAAKAAVAPHGNSFWIRPNLSGLSHRIASFITTNIFHTVATLIYVRGRSIPHTNPMEARHGGH